MSAWSLTDEQAAIVFASDSEACIFACAGSGKTFTLAARIAYLVDEERVDPSKIAAITFTNSAADHLRQALALSMSRHQDAARVFVGTIHGFCSHLLRTCNSGHLAPESTILSQSQTYLLLATHWDAWGINELDGAQNKSRTIERLMSTFDILKLESVDIPKLQGRNPQLMAVLDAYKEFCHDNHLRDFADVLADVRDNVATDTSFRATSLALFDYILVDEYQDVDATQSAIIEEFAAHVSVWVVGDDDQCIYQFRGTDHANILRFANRANCKTFTLSVNRRCRGNIVEAASQIATSLDERAAKSMTALHPGGIVETTWFASAREEAAWVARRIRELVDSGLVADLGQIAVLMRSVATYGDQYVDALKNEGLAVVSRGGRSLFTVPEVRAVWLALEALIPEKPAEERRKLMHQVAALAPTVPSNILEGDLSHIGDRYQQHKYQGVLDVTVDVLAALRFVHSTQDEGVLHNLAELTRLVSDYEEVVQSYSLARLCGYFAAYASRTSDESAPVAVTRRSINVLTVHQAKGLEFRYVFVPMLVSKRFPVETSARSIFLEDDEYPAARYATSVDAERRLFYVALTRASEGVFLSGASDVGLSQPKVPSLFLGELQTLRTPDPPGDALPVHQDEDTPFLVGSYSSLEYYLTCPHRYRLLIDIGFASPRNPFFQFGQVVHAVVASICESASRDQDHSLDSALNDFSHLFDRLVSTQALPPYVVERTRKRGIGAITNFLTKKSDWLASVDEVEREISYVSNRALIKGRLDLMLSNQDGRRTIIDIKTGQAHAYLRPDFQLRFYSLTAREQLDLDIAYAALYYIEHDAEVSIEVDGKLLLSARTELNAVLDGILARSFEATPGEMCKHCEVQRLCEFSQ